MQTELWSILPTIAVMLMVSILEHAQWRPAGPKATYGPSNFTFYMHNTVHNLVVDDYEYFKSVYVYNPYAFGITSTFQDTITSGPSNSSESLGMAQSLEEVDSNTVYHMFRANITDGNCRGTIDIFGSLRLINPTRIMPVFGGTGDFLGAHGLALCRLVSIDRTPPAKWTLAFDLVLFY
ncbi:hypothetical protein KP509_17G016200 [Ceratopteris richardii]|uniref:Dirigent protein n=1 Tax=Ceratopteris richardii TaxID=49495 RepID=A0A8T2SSE7_CERRI|nr:hypothetical protein KP509_17G016200 [Ceratopteris richardii]